MNIKNKKRIHEKLLESWKSNSLSSDTSLGDLTEMLTKK